MFDIGKRIEELRFAKRWSLQQLANKTGYTQSHLSLLEANKRDPSIPALIKIAAAFGITLPAFFKVDISDTSIEKAEVDANAKLDVLARLREMEQEIERMKKDITDKR